MIVHTWYVNLYCLQLKREAERNTNPDRIRWSCKEVMAELEIVHGKLHINKIIEE